MSWWSRQFTSPQGESGLAAEVERFLSGHHLESIFDSAEEIPAWVWLSVVAHGDDEVLERTQHWLAEHHGVRPELDAWGRVLQLVAAQLVETAAAIDCEVSELQRQLLVPLELAVSLTSVGPATLHRLVTVMLSDMSSQSDVDQAS